MTKQEQIVLLIEEFISKYVRNEIILSVSDIRKWPCVDDLCEKHDSANICKAMKKVKFEKSYVSGIEDSTTYKMLFTKKFQNVKTENFISKDELEKSVNLTGWQYVLRIRNKAHIHVATCNHLWKHSDIKLDDAYISIYPTFDIAKNNAEKTLKEIRVCPFCIKK